MRTSALTHSEGSPSRHDVQYWPVALGDRGMSQQVCVVLRAAEREQLAAISADRNRPRKHIERAKIVLASADRHPVRQVAQSIGVRTAVIKRH